MAYNNMQPLSYDSTYVTHVNFREHTIITTVTKDPESVTSWINETENINRWSFGRRIIVGLDVEWRPPFERGNPNPNPVAVLQLCADHRCLIFQIIHSQFVPNSLINFLNNQTYTFTGVRVHDDVERLVRDYGLRLYVNELDLDSFAMQVYGKRIVGLKGLAKEVLGVELQKPFHVRTGPWDNIWLSREQVNYATLDAFLSSEIAKKLFLGFIFVTLLLIYSTLFATFIIIAW